MQKMETQKQAIEQPKEENILAYTSFFFFFFNGMRKKRLQVFLTSNPNGIENEKSYKNASKTLYTFAMTSFNFNLHNNQCK
jgi:hypothetical protein